MNFVQVTVYINNCELSVQFLAPEYDKDIEYLKDAFIHFKQNDIIIPASAVYNYKVVPLNETYTK